MSNQQIQLMHGDSRDVLKTLPSDYFSAIITDPPYMIGFMGKAFDHAKGNIAGDAEFWAEVLRVLKPGGYLAAFGATRTYHRMACAIEDAGFEIRDSLHYMYGSGFPKSRNIGGGIGTALKPSHEPIVLARKHLQGTVAANVAAWGTGGMNIDAGRIGTADTRSKTSMTAMGQGSGWNAHNNREVVAGSECGRWPSNVLLDEHAAAELDKQSGTSQGGKPRDDRGTGGIWSEGNGVPCGPSYGDEGGASRFFPVLDFDPEWDAPFFYTAKPAQSERNAGCDELSGGTIRINAPRGCEADKLSASQPRTNHHPTVKPISVMGWLARLLTPPGGIILDPFLGSGTTGVAAAKNGFGFVGIEKEAEYMAIAKARLNYAQCKTGLFAEDDV